MSDSMYKKDHGPVDQARDTAGIYKLGFEKESFLGLMLPIAFVVGVGGVLGLLIWQFL